MKRDLNMTNEMALSMKPIETARILIVDDNRSIHDDFRKILCPPKMEALDELDALKQGLFGEPSAPAQVEPSIHFELDSAFQGEEAVALFRKAAVEERPYPLAFMDVRMPPGLDGVQTIDRIWKEFPYTEIVICTAFSDYSWEEVVAKLGSTDRLLFISKPFEATAVKQMALALIKKWHLGVQAREYVAQLEKEVHERTFQLRCILEEVKQKNDVLENTNKEIGQMAATLQEERDEQKALNNQLREAQAQLLQSEKMASIGQLAAGIAHEINNPVGYISSNIGTMSRYVQELYTLLNLYEANGSQFPQEAQNQIKALKDGRDYDYIKEDLFDLIEESTQGVNRVREIVEDLKDFSHVDKHEWAVSDLHQGINSTLNIVNNEVKYKAEVIKDFDDLPGIECILSQLNQVFMNLVVNATHAIEERGTITIRTRRENEDWVWVEVSDTGKGISPEHIGKLFEPFFTTKPVGKGTGLGLSVSYGIVKKHGGRIEVESTPGKGAAFRVWLPVTQKEQKKE